MSVGAYGTNISVNLGSNEIESMVDIFYSFSETRSYDERANAKYKRLSSSLLMPIKRETDGDTPDDVLEGMYNLQLPLDTFNKKGFYTIYIHPREYRAVIKSVGSLTAFQNIQGIVFDTNDRSLDSNLKDKMTEPNGLVGYRLIYLNSNATRSEEYRIITSSNLVETIVGTSSSASDKRQTYSYNSSSSLCFVTLTPSSAPSFNPMSAPYIGKAEQEVIIVNTLFEPVMIEVELTTHDADTISYMLENSQLRDLENGTVTTYNDKNEIYSQSEHYTLKDDRSGMPIYEVKKKREGTIDFSEDITQL